MTNRNWIWLFLSAKGRTNFDLHQENYSLREGVAQTMSFFKSKSIQNQRSSCSCQQQGTTMDHLKPPSMIFVTEVSSWISTCLSNHSCFRLKKRNQVKEHLLWFEVNDRVRYQTVICLYQVTNFQVQHISWVSLGPLQNMISTRFLHRSGDSDTKPSRIPVPIGMSTPATSITSRTSSRESLLSEQSNSSAQQRRPSKLPLPVSRKKLMTINSSTTSTKNSWIW